MYSIVSSIVTTCYIVVKSSVKAMLAVFLAPFRFIKLLAGFVRELLFISFVIASGAAGAHFSGLLPLEGITAAPSATYSNASAGETTGDFATFATSARQAIAESPAAHRYLPPVLMEAVEPPPPTPSGWGAWALDRTKNALEGMYNLILDEFKEAPKEIVHLLMWRVVIPGIVVYVGFKGGLKLVSG